MRFLVWFGSALLLLFSSLAFALQLSPMVAELAPSGEKSSQIFVIENRKSEKIAARIQALTRQYDSAGKEIRNPSSDFLIFPTQLVLEPGEKRNIRVTWKGYPIPASEQAYRLVVSQNPLASTNPTETKDPLHVDLLLQYVASIYVKPPMARSNVKVDRVVRKGSRQLEVTIRNHGNAHQVLADSRLEVISNRTRWSIPNAEMKEIHSTNLMPEHERTFTLIAPAQMESSGQLQGEISLP